LLFKDDIVRKVLFLAFSSFICCFILPVNADDIEAKNPALAIGMAQVSNLALFGINRYIRKADYATGVDFDSIARNFRSRWVWDQDEFSVNQIGHPYQGSFYFVAGRANGLSFGESALVTLSGSATWELVYETETPSKNDVIATTMGGMALGEMLHRLYSSAYYGNIPGSFLISPMDSLKNLVTQSKPAKMNEGITGTGISFEAGILNNRRNLDAYRKESARNSLMGNLGVDVIYGNPFTQDTNTPYDHFELHLAGMFSDSGYSLSLFSDGVLFARNPFDTLDRETSVGMSLHYDVIYSSDINFSANAVGVTVKHLEKFSPDRELALKLHLNWMPLATSDYIFLRYGNVPVSYKERRDYDMGTGVSVKAEANFGGKKMGKFDARVVWYGMKTISASVPDGGSEGLTGISIMHLSWEHMVAPRLASGISGYAYVKKARYTNAPDVDDETGSVSLFLRYYPL
jgi:hypothetical protein